MSIRGSAVTKVVLIIGRETLLQTGSDKSISSGSIWACPGDNRKKVLEAPWMVDVNPPAHDLPREGGRVLLRFLQGSG